MAERLAKHHYFTEATVNGKRIQFFQHRNTVRENFTRKNKGRFWSKLTLDLSQPIDPKKISSHIRFMTQHTTSKFCMWKNSQHLS